MSHKRPYMFVSNVGFLFSVPSCFVDVMCSLFPVFVLACMLNGYKLLPFSACCPVTPVKTCQRESDVTFADSTDTDVCVFCTLYFLCFIPFLC